VQGRECSPFLRARVGCQHSSKSQQKQPPRDSAGIPFPTAPWSRSIPLLSFGKPIVAKQGVPTSVPRSACFAEGRDPFRVARQYGVPVSDPEREAWRCSKLIAFRLEPTWSKPGYWEKTQAPVKWSPRILDQARLLEGRGRDRSTEPARYQTRCPGYRCYWSCRSGWPRKQYLIQLVGVRGFEPPASTSRT
jgi:hypothetical protein